MKKSINITLRKESYDLNIKETHSHKTKETLIKQKQVS